MSAGAHAFEVLRFEAVPAAAGVALLELEGRFLSGGVPAKPRILVELRGRARELPAVVDGGEPQAWAATFAVPIEALDGDPRGFALVPGRGPVIGLPAPDLASGEDDRFVRLARSANDLRHRLAEASASAATSSERFAEVAEERDRLAAELADVRARLESTEEAAKEIRAAGEAADAAAAEARAAQERADAELAETRERLEAQTTRAESAEAATDHERVLREEARAEVERLQAEIAATAHEAEELQTKLVAAEDAAEAADLELRDVRSRLVALQREREHQRPPAAPHGAVSSESVPLEWDDDTEPTAALVEEPEEDRDRFTTSGDEGEPPADTEPTGEVVPAPRTPGARRTIRLEPHDDDTEILDPAAVGARFIEPSTTKPPLLALTPARIAVGVAVLLLVIALVVIFAGGGLV